MVGWATAMQDTSSWLWIGAPICGYGFAWIGHFFFERNRPATFQYPLWSLRGDVVMWWQTIISRELALPPPHRQR